MEDEMSSKHLATGQRMERGITRTIVRDALAAGYSVSVSLERGYDTEEMLKGSTDSREIVAEALAGDECHLFVHAAGVDPVGADGAIDCIGWVFLAFGNDGWDLVNDYTTNLEGMLTNATKLADRYEEREYAR